MEAGTDATFGFEFYSSTTGTVSSDPAQVQTGLRSIKCDSTGSGLEASVLKQGILDDAGRRISCYFRFSTLPTADTDILIAWASGDTSNPWSLRLRTSGKLALWSASQLGTDGSTLSINTWYRISVAYKITSTTVYDLRVFVNGVLDISVTNGTALFTTGTLDLAVGWIGDGTNNAITNVDDLYVDDSAALTDPGNIHITAKLPNSNNVNNFNTAIGANPANRWTNVNERALSETNGWGDNAASTQLENYTLQTAAVGDVDISAATIIARMAWIWAKQLIAVAGTPGITNNGTTTGITLTTTSTLYTDIVDSSIYPSDVAGIGMRSAGVAADATDLFECGMLIAYIPGVPLPVLDIPSILNAPIGR